MAKPYNVVDLPRDIIQLAEAQVKTGRYASVEEVLRAGVETLADEQAEADAADTAAWRDYQGRQPKDIRDLTAAEALACLESADPDQQRVLIEHLDTLRDEVLAGKDLSDTPAELLASVRARLGIPSV
jgi:Arc/MetJ-type ribon-helix-helix transcriptional regulator